MPNLDEILPQIITAATFIVIFAAASAVWRAILRSIGRQSEGNNIGFWSTAAAPGYLLIASVTFFAFCHYSGLGLLRPDIDQLARMLVTAALVLMICELLFFMGLRYYSGYTEGEEFPSIFRQLLKGLVYLILFLSFVSNTYKVDITPLLTTSAVFTMVLGLALQDVLGNLFAGLSVHISPPFRIGDWISINNIFGKVTESNWRATTIRQSNSAIVVIPNNQISKHEIINYSDAQGRIFREFTIGLSYEVSPERIRRLLASAARQVEEIFTDPAPIIVLKDFDAYTVKYKIRFWIANEGFPDRVTGKLASRIWYRLKREGLSIPFPISDVFIHQEKDDREKQIEHRLSLISGIDFMAGLDMQLKTFIAERLQECWYESGEEIVTEGAFDTDFYIIDRGRVSVFISNAGKKPVAELAEGDFFGEMSLLTGEKRSASIVAKVETRLLKLNRDSMARLLSANVQVAEKLSTALAERSSKNNTLLAALDQSKKNVSRSGLEENAARAAILRRICSFFKL